MIEQVAAELKNKTLFQYCKVRYLHFFECCRRDNQVRYALYESQLLCIRNILQFFSLTVFYFPLTLMSLLHNYAFHTN